MEPIEFDAGERAAILAEAQRLGAEPLPADRRGIGCLTVIISGVMLLALPPLAKRYHWPPLVADVLFWPLAIVCALGFFAAFLLTTSRYSRASARARDALAWLACHPGARDAEARRHAVALVCYHAINDDGGVAQVIDVDEAKKNLGEDLHYVVAVERVLAGENSSDIYFGKT
jgi:hypothetical protein